ncbi:hypothetical protein HMPREF9017_01561 [Parascardovia denticolens F0305]|nr:hypothetical protein HMPREF9017_01561 [Parascardovia denticolens F0305]
MSCDFNPRSPCGERPRPTRGRSPSLGISIHAPLAGSDGSPLVSCRSTDDFNPRSPCGERPSWIPATHPAAHFNPRSPCGERRISISLVRMVIKFQSTLPLRGATGLPDGRLLAGGISIHAPLAGSDLPCLIKQGWRLDFNPRSPCGERQFQKWFVLLPGYFNPRSPCGERPVKPVGDVDKVAISIHAPLAGSDLGRPRKETRSEISIHAPLAGSDRQASRRRRQSRNFNPRSPCGERPQ